ncbi:MAG: type II secretion system protein [Anaerohalosphaeraceae bacterium]
MRTSNGGFTLVEILIVVVILGILAAIVIPQFTQASTEARESSLVSNLQTIRSQIELYKIQHNDNPPTDATTFEAQMTGLTDVDGNAAAAPGPGVFGPYLQKIPVNPFTPGNNNVAGAAGDSWSYTNNGNGSYTFIANDGGSCPDGTAHEDL